MTLHNTFPTNGTLPDDDWCAFFKRHGYWSASAWTALNGCTTATASTRGGKESFRQVMRGLNLLKKHGVVERDNTTGFQEGTDVTERSVTGAGYGRFLRGVFDLRVREDVGRVQVQMCARGPGRPLSRPVRV